MSLTQSLDVASQEELVEQISQLHLLVQEMKDGFTGALLELSSIQQDDKVIEEKLQENKNECQEQISEVLKVVNELKADFRTVLSQLQETTENQNNLKEQIDFLQYERDLLLEELEKSGSISEKLRGGHQARSLTTSTENIEENEPEEISQHPDSDRTTDNNIDTSDKFHDNRHGDGESSCSLPLSPSCPSNNNGIADFTTDDNLNYESDSSITQAATLTLSLTKTLHSRCLENSVSSDEDEEVRKETSAGQRSQHGKAENNQENRNEGSGASRNSSFGAHDGRVSSPAKQLLAESKRHETAQEILETEKKYVACLAILQQHFALPLRQSSLLPPRDVNAIFPAYLNVFHQRHTALLKQLEERIYKKKWEGMLGDLFARLIDPCNKDLLQCYSDYVTDFPHSIEMINQWSKQSHKFRKFLKKQLSELNCSNVGLATYLLAPLQRIPKYVLLLKQLLKYTTEDNPDYYYMQTAVQGLNEFINNMNTAIQEAFKVLNSSTQSPPKKIESSGSHEFSSNSSIDLHKLSHSSTALSTSSHKDSGIHSTVLSIDDLEVDLELLPDDDRSSLDKLRRPKLYRKSVTDLSRNSEGKYTNSSEDGNDSLTLSYRLNSTTPEPPVSRRRRKDKTHAKARPKEESHLYKGRPSRSATDTQLNIHSSGVESTIPQSQSMYYSLPNRDLSAYNTYISQLPNYHEQQLGGTYVSAYDGGGRYTPSLLVDPNTGYQYIDANAQYMTNNLTAEPHMNIPYNHFGGGDPVHEARTEMKPSTTPRKIVTKKPSFGIYGNNDPVNHARYEPTRAGQMPSRVEQFTQRKKQEQLELQQLELSRHGSSPILDAAALERQRLCRTPIPMGSTSSLNYDPALIQRSSTPLDGFIKPQVITSVWEDDVENSKKNKSRIQRSKQKNYEVGEKSAKKPSLKNSLRTMFFKKNVPTNATDMGQSSRVVEFDESAVTTNISGHHTGNGDVIRQRTSTPIPMTYKDENGDPCSAV